MSTVPAAPPPSPQPRTRRAVAHPPSARERMDRWTPTLGRAIASRLSAHREELADLLLIDPTDEEWRIDPVPMPHKEGLTPEERYLRWRKTPPRSGRPVPRIDLALEELGELIRGNWRHLRGQKLSGRYIKTGARGRPKGTADLFSQELAIALAEFYLRYTAARPARRVNHDTGHLEYGPFKQFVACTLGLLPLQLRRTRKGAVKGIDALVRRGVRHARTLASEPSDP